MVVVSNLGDDTSKRQFVSPASIFNFADEYWYHGPVVANIGDIYGPISGSAEFQFIDLSSTGTPGDFELLLTCSEMCTNIGFNLGGVSFSASTFNPSSAPSQLVSYNFDSPGPGITNGTWDFLFRNSAALPEPGTWAMMLLGFGLIGCAFRLTQHPARPDSTPRPDPCATRPSSATTIATGGARAGCIASSNDIKFPGSFSGVRRPSVHWSITCRRSFRIARN